MKISLPPADAYQADAERLGLTFGDYLRLPIGGADVGNVSPRIPVLHSLIACEPEILSSMPGLFATWAPKMARTAINFLGDADLRSRVAVAQGPA
jgi:hypothetical protein